jgi:hypothetical protein
VNQRQEAIAKRTDRQSAREWTHLILKLRWMGLDDDAKCLELAVSTLPLNSRGSISADLLITD